VTCREVADFLMDYLDGQLASAVVSEFERHLELCESCRYYLAHYITATELGKRAFDDEDFAARSAGVPEELIQAILAARTRRP
jgi:anti-sigma factor RsiW